MMTCGRGIHAAGKARGVSRRATHCRAGGGFSARPALSVSAATGSAKIVRILAELTEQMSQGEVHQLMRKGDIHLAEDEYLEVIRRKTAVLFETACRVSAVLANAPEERESAWRPTGSTWHGVSDRRRSVRPPWKHTSSGRTSEPICAKAR
jgi:hypothetical protein